MWSLSLRAPPARWRRVVAPLILTSPPRHLLWGSSLLHHNAWGHVTHPSPHPPQCRALPPARLPVLSQKQGGQGRGRLLTLPTSPQPHAVMELRPRRRRVPQPPPAGPFSPTAPLRVLAGSPQVPSPPKRKRHVPEEEVCRLCRRADGDPEVFGQTCQQDGLRIHENCLYHASGLSQQGADGEGFYGFLLPDIHQELQRVAQKTCCICRRRGASVTCKARRCPRIFHFPCGIERGCVSQFFGEFKSFCWQHRPAQRLRALQQGPSLCVICLEAVARRPCYDTLVCPACTSAWFHRRCIQGQALSAALHHFRCPLCQDMQTFQEEMFRLGIKIPDRDAAWEEDRAFEDHHQRHSSCDASQCLCPVGREQSEDTGPWRLLLCSSCGSCGTHQRCSDIREDTSSWECSDCANTCTSESCSWGTGWPPWPPALERCPRHGTRRWAQGCDGWSLCSSLCPFQPPRYHLEQPTQTPQPRRRDPRAAPRLLGVQVWNTRLGCCKDTPAPSCSPSPQKAPRPPPSHCPTTLEDVPNKTVKRHRWVC
uniref:PHD finger protein 7 n=1 Tax=Anser cygnoides TaxID=8845 RepID=A0A8B9EQ75_ANSCY